MNVPTKSMKFIWVLAVLPWLGACEMQQLVHPDTDAVKLHEEAERAYGANDMQLAEKDFKLLAESMPRDAEPWFRLGNIYARSNRVEDAIHAYREAVTRNPNLTKAWYNMALVQMHQARKDLLEMQQYLGADDPINPQVQHIQETLDTLLKPTAPDQEVGQDNGQKNPPH